MSIGGTEVAMPELEDGADSKSAGSLSCGVFFITDLYIANMVRRAVR